MRNHFFIFIILLTTSCCQNVNPQKSCNENLDFRKKFFSRIDTVDMNVKTRGSKYYRQSLLFLANYAPVNFSSMLNYSNAYPYNIYLQDRKGWIEWYEKNKCNNIQF